MVFRGEKSEINDPNAVAVATADKSNQPNVRMVLLKGLSNKGFVFYTNFTSKKGEELKNNLKSSMCFHWKSLRRQVRVLGTVEEVSKKKRLMIILILDPTRIRSEPGHLHSLKF